MDARGEIITRLPRNRNATGLVRVLELRMTATSGNKIRAVGLQQAQGFANFHQTSISGAPNVPGATQAQPELE